MNEPNFYLKTMWQGVLAVVLCACFAIPAQAQTPVVTLDARNVTIKDSCSGSRRRVLTRSLM